MHPHIGQRSVSDVTRKAVLERVQQVEQRGALEMAARVLETVGMVFRYGCGTGLIQIDVTQGLRQLAHRDRNKVRRAYNHAMYLEERKKLMQWWSDYLDEQLEKAS